MYFIRSSLSPPPEQSTSLTEEIEPPDAVPPPTEEIEPSDTVTSPAEVIESVDGKAPLFYRIQRPEIYLAEREQLWWETDVVTQALRYGFLGAYVYCIQLIYRRYTTLDLQPTVYLNCTLTLLASFAFNLTAFGIISNLGPGGIGMENGNSSSSLETGVFAIIAFSLGYFPLLAIRWFEHISASIIGIYQMQGSSMALSVIDGMSTFHQTRLRDEGIDNVQNLASAKIEDLLLNTRFTAQQLLDWVDQAILYIHIDYAYVDTFRRIGIRAVSDFRDQWVEYLPENLAPLPQESVQNGNITAPDAPSPTKPPVAANGQSTEIGSENGPAQQNSIHGTNTQVGAPKRKRTQEERERKAFQLQSTPEYLDSLYISTAYGPNIAYIENFWHTHKETVKKRLVKSAADVSNELQTPKEH